MTTSVVVLRLRVLKFTLLTKENQAEYYLNTARHDLKNKEKRRDAGTHLSREKRRPRSHRSVRLAVLVALKFNNTNDSQQPTQGIFVKCKKRNFI